MSKKLANTKKPRVYIVAEMPKNIKEAKKACNKKSIVGAIENVGEVELSRDKSCLSSDGIANDIGSLSLNLVNIEMVEYCDKLIELYESFEEFSVIIKLDKHAFVAFSAKVVAIKNKTYELSLSSVPENIIEVKKEPRKKALKALLKENEAKLNYANETVHDLMEENNELLNINKVTEKHIQMAETELQAKERLIIDLKDWIYTLIQGSEQ